MKAVTTKAELANLISKLQGIIAQKPAIPILSSVLIEATEDQLVLSATDLTTSMRCYAEAKVIEEGSIALPARRFFQLIKELTSPQIKLTSTENDIAEISAGSSIFKINGMPKSEFPTLPNFSGSAEICIDSTTLKEMFVRTSFSAAREDSRHVLNGMLFQIINKKAIFVGTDGKRLAKIETPVEIDNSFHGSYILPIKAVEEICKMLDENTQKATLGLMHDKVFLESNNAILATKLLTGQYPEIEKVIPKTKDNPILLHREELMSLLRQISLFTTESSGSVRFIFETGQLELLATSNEIGEGKVSMPANYQGARQEIAFNPFYFLDILRHTKDETVSLYINGSYSPGVVTDSTSAIYVIMPMRLNETSETPQINVSEKPAFA